MEIIYYRNQNDVSEDVENGNHNIDHNSSNGYCNCTDTVLIMVRLIMETDDTYDLSTYSSDIIVDKEAKVSSTAVLRFHGQLECTCLE